MIKNNLETFMQKFGINKKNNPYLKIELIKFKIPEIYRNFLINYSEEFREKDLDVFCEEIEEYVDIFDVIPSKYNTFDSVIETYSDRIGSEYLPIFMSNGGGDLILLKSNGEIFYWFHEDQMFYLISKNISDFFNKIKSDESSGGTDGIKSFSLPF